MTNERQRELRRRKGDREIERDERTYFSLGCHSCKGYKACIGFLM